MISVPFITPSPHSTPYDPSVATPRTERPSNHHPSLHYTEYIFTTSLPTEHCQPAITARPAHHVAPSSPTPPIQSSVGHRFETWMPSDILFQGLTRGSGRVIYSQGYQDQLTPALENGEALSDLFFVVRLGLVWLVFVRLVFGVFVSDFRKGFGVLTLKGTLRRTG